MPSSEAAKVENRAVCQGSGGMSLPFRRWFVELEGIPGIGTMGIESVEVIVWVKCISGEEEDGVVFAQQ